MARQEVRFNQFYFLDTWLTVDLEVIGQSIERNTSTIKYVVAMERRNNWNDNFYSSNGNLNLTIDGRNVGGTGISWDIRSHPYASKRVVIKEGTTEVQHNADGSKAFNWSLWFDPNAQGLGGAGDSREEVSLNGSMQMTTIPRASSISASAGTIGSPIPLSISRASNSFLHTIKFKFHNQTYTIATNISTSYTWTPSMELCRLIPNTTSSWGTLVVETYASGIYVGTKETTLTLNVPAHIKPSLSSISLSDTHAKAAQLVPGNSFVQILSNIRVAFNGASGSYGSTIQSYKAEIVGKNNLTTSQNGLLGVMNYTGTYQVRATVTDSRGRVSDARTINITILPYHTPIISFDVTRTGSTNTTLTVNRSIKIAPLIISGRQKNTMKLLFKTRLLNGIFANNSGAGGTWSTTHQLLASNANLSGVFAADQSYEVVGVLTDSFDMTSEFKMIVGTERVVMSYSYNGLGVGKVHERGVLDVAGDIYANDKAIQQHQLTAHDGNIKQATGDWNNYTETGFYWGRNLTNQPTGTHEWRYVEVLRYDSAGKWVIQKMVDFNGRVTAQRARENGVWKPWNYILTTDTMPDILKAFNDESKFIEYRWGAQHDMNTIKKTGLYFVGSGRNCPCRGLMLVARVSGNETVQVIFDVDSNKTYRRITNWQNGVWGAWTS